MASHDLRRLPWRRGFTLVFALITILSSNQAYAQEAHQLSVKEALRDVDGDRVPDRIGETVILFGVVTVTPVASAAGGTQMNLQDGTGGIRLSSPDRSLLAQHFTRGDFVRVQGQIEHEKGVEALRVYSIRRVSTRAMVYPRDVLTSDLDGERYSGQLVRVAGYLEVPSGLAGESTQLLLRDRSGEIRVLLRAQLFQRPRFIERLVQGGRVELTGIASQYDEEPPFVSGYQLVPRSPEDFVFEPRPPYRAIAGVAAVAGALALTLYLVIRRRRAEQRTKELEARVAERTSELAAANKELEAFSYSVSHDLRSPLRAIDGFSKALLEDYGDRLDPAARHYLERVRAASQRMGELIDALLGLSRVTRAKLLREKVDLSDLARGVASELTQRDPARTVQFEIAPALQAKGDPRLLRIVLENLLGNAWKFTEKHPSPTIQLGAIQNNGHSEYFVRDNGVGFDMAYANKLFGAFQRLHAANDFAGTGIGLATVQRIIQRHGGHVWAESAVDRGATFFFTLH